MTGSLLADALARDPGRPFVTFYDDARAERVELSVTTLANWVAKTANLIVDGLGLGPGDALRLDVPRHWQLPVWALAAWTVGLVVDLDGDPSRSRLAVCGPGGIEAALAADEVVALSLRPFGAPFAPGELPRGVVDYGREVAGYGDHFPGTSGNLVDLDVPAITVGGTTLTSAESRARAASLAAAWDMGTGGRLLVSDPLEALPELLAATLVPLSVHGSVVLTRGENPAPEAVAARARSERTTAVARAGVQD